MNVPHYINEDKSDMRGIKSGWYAIADDGNITSGPFFSRGDCLQQITTPRSGSISAEVLLRPE